MKCKIMICIFVLMFWASLIALGWMYDLRAAAISCEGYLALVGVIVCGAKEGDE